VHAKLKRCKKKLFREATATKSKAPKANERVLAGIVLSWKHTGSNWIAKLNPTFTLFPRTNCRPIVILRAHLNEGPVIHRLDSDHKGSVSPVNGAPKLHLIISCPLTNVIVRAHLQVGLAIHPSMMRFYCFET
jgi:hypothetical protein